MKLLNNFSGVKLFPCDICEQKFSSNVALKEHIARHTDTRPYKCDVCDRWFRQVSCLRRHMITHSDETPFSCNVCGRKFSQMVYLKSHMRMHTGKLPRFNESNVKQNCSLYMFQTTGFLTQE